MAPVESRGSLFSLFFAPELRALHGRMSLTVVFWGYGVALSMVLAILHATALDAGQLVFQQILILVSVVYTVWILVSIFQCAQNASPFWGTVARWLTVTWGLNTAFVLFFLQFELTLRYVQG